MLFDSAKSGQAASPIKRNRCRSSCNKTKISFDLSSMNTVTAFYLYECIAVSLKLALSAQKEMSGKINK